MEDPVAISDLSSASIIPGLPPELALTEILPSISWFDIQSSAVVSKAWRAAFRDLSSRHSQIQDSDFNLNLMVSPSPKSIFRLSLFNPKKSSWEPLPPVPGLDSGFPQSNRFAFHNNTVYVLGGLNPKSGRFLNDVYKIDLSASFRIWDKCSSMKTARIGFACMMIGDRIYVAGGQGEDCLALASVEAYDLKKDRWDILPDLANPLSNCIGAITGNLLCILGGYTFQCNRECSRDSDPNHEHFLVDSKQTLAYGSKTWISEEISQNFLDSCRLHSGRLHHLCAGIMKRNSMSNGHLLNSSLVQL